MSDITVIHLLSFTKVYNRVKRKSVYVGTMPSVKDETHEECLERAAQLIQRKENNKWTTKA
jgi:hypothetical protein